LAAVLDGSGLGWTAWCRDWTYYCTFLLLFLFLSPNVLSSTTFCFLARSAFDGCPFFGGILTGFCSRARERRELGGGRREAATEEFLGLGLDCWRKGKAEAEARRKFLEMLSISCPKWMLGLQRGFENGLGGYGSPVFYLIPRGSHIPYP
jgi:hypothetical protein